MRQPFESRFAPRPKVAARAPTDAETALARANQVAQTGRAIWFGLLGYLAFVTLTLLSVRDIDFFSLESTVDLPLVNIAIPTSVFFWSAAWLAAAFHAFLQIHLLKLWDPLAALPATWKGRPVAEALHPWIVIDWGLRRRPDAEAATVHRPLAGLADAVALTAVWLAGPAVIAAFWWRSMPAHDEGMTIAIAAALLLAVYASRRNWRRARAALDRAPLRAAVEPEKDRLRFRGRLWLGLLGALLLAVSWARTEGGFDHYANRAIDAWEQAMGPEFEEELDDEGYLLRTAQEVQDDWVRSRFLTLDDLSGQVENPGMFLRWLGLIGVVEIEGDVATWSPFAPIDLVNADLAGRPADWADHDIAKRRFRVGWCRDHAIPPEACHAPVEDGYGDEFGDIVETGETGEAAFVQAQNDFAAARALWCEKEGAGRALAGAACAARFAALDRMAETEWTARRADELGRLRKPDMRGRDLRLAQAHGAFLAGLNLNEARLEAADLSEARLEGANLSLARLERANLFEARMERTDLSEARLERANLTLARLEGANLFEVRMEEAILSLARMERTDLRRARMERTDFTRARLEGANLFEAQLERADLGEARLEEAILSSARMEEAILSSARMERSDFTRARLEGVDLSWARLEGADLSLASFKSARWSRATFGPSLAYVADFSDAVDLTQSQLDDGPGGPLIGDDDTILPRDAQTGEQLVIWSCWETLTPAIDRLLTRHDITEEGAREAGWLCSEANPRRRTGRPAP
ncbi:MAG: pentapeptide repeat-containing protein [Rubrimonas sp.]|uniref:pentapeptide repeat-containing protein n=1 Tax=Rubrimonas sp. TaxID=2036015 RepID=UPI002FDE4AE5